MTNEQKNKLQDVLKKYCEQAIESVNYSGVNARVMEIEIRLFEPNKTEASLHLKAKHYYISCSAERLALGKKDGEAI